MSLNITESKGFQMTFDNGFTVSVQMGWSNYRSGRDLGKCLTGSFSEANLDAGKTSANLVECAVWGDDGKFIKHELFDGEEVGGWMSMGKVLELLNWAESQ